MSSGPHAALRKIGEDSLLRPFLSTLFDPHAYVKTIIRDGKSEECFHAIIESVDLINEEIKQYISLHKDVLMSGMQDVANLADRYASLSELSKVLQSNITRLKKELSESYNLVRSKTYELERIHSACHLINQVKQFVTAKKALDDYLQNPEDRDARSLAVAAKTISELEKLLSQPQLLEIQIIQRAAPSIKSFASHIRILAQEKLIEAIKEKNQAAMANYLQVFYNLDSLPEVIIAVIDQMTKVTLEGARDSLDLTPLQALYADYMNRASTSATTTATTTTTGSATKKSTSLSSAGTNSSMGGSGSSTTNNLIGSGSSQQGVVSIVQLRIAIRELAHSWSTIIYDHATQILVFQRVVQKKEDPTSHRRFIDVLKAASFTNSSLAVLQQGQLLALFWQRLSMGLMDISHEKLKNQPTVACRIYPYLRRAAMEVVANVQAWSEQDQHAEHNTTSQFLQALHVVSEKERQYYQPQYEKDSLSSSSSSALAPAVSGLFGSLLWGNYDLLGCLPQSSHSVLSYSTSSSLSTSNLYSASNESKQSNDSSRGNPSVSNQAKTVNNKTSSFAAGGGGVPSGGNGGTDHDLLEGLRPLKDRFLAYALERMNAPILQMFPEVEGYTAAIPSRRDLQTLTKAIQVELLQAAIESEHGLVTAIGKEMVKVVKLMLSKMGDMILNNSETRKISLQNNFSRSHAQDHNAQLFALLIHFKESLESIPSQVIRQVNETNSMALTTLQAETLLSEMMLQSKQATSHIDELAYEIVEGVVSLLVGYSESILLGIHREGAIPLLPSASNKPALFSGITESYTDCSLAVQTLIKQLPNMLKAHLHSLAKSPLIEMGNEELALRILQSYISIAALTRPVNEQSRLRTAQDMMALEQALSSFFNISALHNCPILAEYRAFRRLLFEDLSVKPADKSQETTTGNNDMKIPDRKVVFSLDYADALRPSTLLAYLICCGPTQLPLPHEAMGREMVYYIDGLLDCTNNSLSSSSTMPSFAPFGGSAMLASARGLYKKEGWAKVRNERQNWEEVQQALDIFFQRIAVAEGEKKVEMRTWYEAIIDIGSHYFK
eukprot:gene10063-11137_t